MVVARFTKDDSRRQVSLHVKGHAEATHDGKDWICAAASILYYTLAQNVKMEEARGTAKPNPTVKLKKGDAIITCRANNDAGYDELIFLYSAIQSGYAVLAHNYPANVAVIMFGEPETA